MRKFTPYAAPAALVALAIIFFMPAPEHDRPNIVFRPDPPATVNAPVVDNETEAPAPQRLLPPDKPYVPAWEMRKREQEAKEAVQAESERTVYVKRGGKRYHKATCQFAEGAVAVKKSDALAHDYSPCEVCGG